jgi:hypothetical protein
MHVSFPIIITGACNQPVIIAPFSKGKKKKKKKKGAKYQQPHYSIEEKDKGEKKKKKKKGARRAQLYPTQMDIEPESEIVKMRRRNGLTETGLCALYQLSSESGIASAPLEMSKADGTSRPTHTHTTVYQECMRRRGGGGRAYPGMEERERERRGRDWRDRYRRCWCCSHGCCSLL